MKLAAIGDEPSSEVRSSENVERSSGEVGKVSGEDGNSEPAGAESAKGRVVGQKLR